MRRCGIAILVLALAAARPASADGDAQPVAAAPPVPTNSVTIIFGVFTNDYWARSFRVREIGYEPNFVVAVISGRELLVTGWGLRIGHESGVAVRFGADFSIELWRGVTVSFAVRLPGGRVFAPKIILGLSSVTNPIGVEVGREAQVVNGDMDRLVYQGTQFGYYLENAPFGEIVYRLHHRSGALGMWGNVPDGHNANVVGLSIFY